MPIYSKPVKLLMHDFAVERLKFGQTFTKAEPVAWFAEKYPKIKSSTVQLHVEGMAINNPVFRASHRNVKPGSGHDLFYKLGPGLFRLWNKDTDPAPQYGDEKVSDEVAVSESPAIGDGSSEESAAGASAEFAFERDLKNYLAKNLSVLETGLSLYEEEEISGIEYPVGGRFIDILAVDKTGGFVVVELKVSRGYDRTLGQLLRYMAWIQVNLASGKRVRGIVVANEITDDLKMAASLVPDVQLAEYEISFKLKPLRSR